MVHAYGTQNMAMFAISKINTLCSVHKAHIELYILTRKIVPRPSMSMYYES
jgi:hypothetical protein